MLFIVAIAWLVRDDAPELTATAMTPVTDAALPHPTPSQDTAPSAPADLDAGTIAPLVIVPKPDESCAIRGKVVGQDGAPVAGAGIASLLNPLYLGGVNAAEIGWDPTWQDEDLRSGSDGTFLYEADYRCPYKLAATTEHNRRGECQPERSDDAHLVCVAWIEEAWEINGTVVDRENRPVAGVRVSATQTWNAEAWHALMDPDAPGTALDSPLPDPASLWSYGDFTDARGRFTIGPLTRDDWTVMAEKKAYRRDFAEQNAEDLTRGAQLRLTIEPVACWDVVVLDEDEMPVPGVGVGVLPTQGHQSFGMHFGTTDQNGATAVCEVSSFNAEVSVDSPRHARVDARNRDGTDPLVMHVHGAGTLIGTIGLPPCDACKGVNVRAENCVEMDERYCGFLGHIDFGPGPFLLERVPAGEMTVVFHVNQYVLGESPPEETDAWLPKNRATIERQVVIRAGETTDLGQLVF